MLWGLNRAERLPCCSQQQQWVCSHLCHHSKHKWASQRLKPASCQDRCLRWGFWASRTQTHASGRPRWTSQGRRFSGTMRMVCIGGPSDKRWLLISFTKDPEVIKLLIWPVWIWACWSRSQCLSWGGRVCACRTTSCSRPSTPVFNWGWNRNLLVGFSPFGVYLNSAGSVDSMGVLVPRECVRVERSEDVTHPEKIHFEGQICVWISHKISEYLEQGMVSSTPPHCQILKLISRFSPEISLLSVMIWVPVKWL